jgi:HEAT repeat protein
MQDPFAELTSGDDKRAEESIPAILALGESALPTLLELTRSNDPDSRWWAVRALAASPHAQTSDLLPLLDDPASEVRAAAALALYSFPHESAIAALVKSLFDEDTIVSGLAVNALAKIGKPATTSLLDVMEKAPLHVRILAVRALSEICDHRAIPALMKSLTEESAVLHYWAEIGLQRLGLDMVYIKP